MDNLANEQVASGKGYSSRSRHFLRRYFALMQRIQRGEAVLVKVSDEQNPADFLTKYVPMKKLRMSICSTSFPPAGPKNSSMMVAAIAKKATSRPIMNRM